MYELPTELEVNGLSYDIRKRGDYRMVLYVFSILEDSSITQSERILTALMTFYEAFDDFMDIVTHPDVEGLTKAMFKFFNAGRPEGKLVDRKLIDWETDSAMVMSAVNNVAHREVRSDEYTHWWTFMGYYMAIGESTLSTVVGLRDKILRGKPLEKWERQFKQENPQYFTWNHKTIEDIEAEEWLKSVWNKE